MRNRSLQFRFFGIDVLVPTSGVVGLLLISYLALPTSMALLDEDSVTIAVFLLGLGHALAIYATIFIHELGHVIAARMRHYEVQGIVLHIFGGHTSFFGKYRSPFDQFITSIFGPLFTLFVSVFAYLVFQNSTGLILSLSSWLLWSSLAITLVNLLPGVPLDGGGVLASLVWKITNKPERGQLIAGYGGYFVAGIWILSPFLYQYFLGWTISEIDIFFSAMIGVWLFTSARISVQMVKTDLTLNPKMETIHNLRVRDIARRAISVDENESLQHALMELNEKKAGSILVSKSNAIVGIVHEKFLASVSEVDYNLPVAQFAIRTNSSEWINYNENISHNSKIETNFPYGQFVVIDDDGAIYGVLHTSDINAELGSK